MTTRANLYVDQGADFLVGLDLLTDDGEIYIVTTEQFFCQIRKVYSSSVTFEAELEIAQCGDDSQLQLFISNNKTKNINPGKYHYDIIMKLDNGVVQKLLEGLLFILPTVTIKEEVL